MINKLKGVIAYFIRIFSPTSFGILSYVLWSLIIGWNLWKLSFIIILKWRAFELYYLRWLSNFKGPWTEQSSYQRCWRSCRSDGGPISTWKMDDSRTRVMQEIAQSFHRKAGESACIGNKGHCWCKCIWTDSRSSQTKQRTA